MTLPFDDVTIKAKNALELNKYDFEAIDWALKFASAITEDKALVARMEQLKDKFAKAHSAYLDMDEGEEP